MNVLCLDQFSDLGGAQRCLLDLLPAVRERGWKTLVAAPGQGALARAALAGGAQFEPIRCGPYSLGRKLAADLLRFAWETPRLAATIRRLAEDARADLIYVNGPRLLPAAARAARGRWPVLFHCHNHLPQRYAAWLAGRSLRSAGATVAACCRFVARPLLPYVAPHQLHVVDNGVEEGQRRTVAPGGRRIGVVGRIAPEKGQDVFLRAARFLPDCQFVICGDALFSDPAAQRYRRSLADLAAGLPVEFLGWREDVYSVLAGLNLLAVPSLAEPGTPRVILEAYACGVPVVAFPSGGITEIVANGKTGVLVEPSTPEALADGMRAVLERPPRLAELAEAAAALWRERFTLARYREQMLTLMASAAGR